MSNSRVESPSAGRAHRVVAVTPAGRRRYLELLKHYVLNDDTFDEWVLWDNCRDPADRIYIEELARTHPKIRIERLPDVDGTNRSINRFYASAADPGVFYVKMDDDLVWLQPGLGEALYRRALEERGRFLWWSPLVVNNALCAWLLKHQAGFDIDAPLTAQAACPIGWGSPEFAAALHGCFLGALFRGRAGVFRTGDFEVSLSRFSINCLGFFGKDVAALGERFCPPEVDDEEWLSAVLPATTGRPGRILGDLTVAHFAYYTQEEALLKGDVLAAYYAAAGLPAPVLPPPRPGLPPERERRKRYQREFRQAFASLTNRTPPPPPPPTYAVRPPRA